MKNSLFSLLKSNSISFVIAAFLAMAVVSCKNADSEPDKEVVLPKFETDKPSFPIEVTANSAKVVSEVNSTNGECLEQYGVYWSAINKLPTAADNKIELGKYCGPFPVSFQNEIKSLASGTVYYIRPFAISAQGTSYGATQEVKPGGVAPVFPAVFGVPVITHNEITFNAYIESSGGSSVIQHGFVYSTNVFAGATIADNVTKLGSYTGVFPGAFTGKVNGLKPETAYTIRPYAVNASGLSYGRALPFTTLKQP
jgi:hypothetical protein